MTIQFVASERHFVEHLAPVWEALPPDQRGPIWCGIGMPRHADAVVWGRRHGYPTRVGWPPPHARGVAVAVAVGDLGIGRQRAPMLRWVFGEHGCGLTYQGASSSYIGSTARANVDLIVVPSHRAAEIQTEATPNIPVLVIGSTAKLDPWAPGGQAREAWKAPATPVVALSFHYDLDMVNETRSAMGHYAGVLGGLRAFGWEILGHAHPRQWEKAQQLYKRVGIEPVRYFDEVLERASLYCVDNSSTLYEFAATGRPVVALNCPLYRRDVHHGLRFWEDIPGLQCDHAGELGATIEKALKDGAAARKLRDRATARVYPEHDGHSARRFADALVELAGAPEPGPKRRDPRPFKVHDTRGKMIRAYATRYEANGHARKIGGTVGAPVADAIPVD